MIYGLNFNGSHIPPGVKRKFAQRIRVDGQWFELKGVGQTEVERDAMLIAGSNGRRVLHVETRNTATGPWYGVYA